MFMKYVVMGKMDFLAGKDLIKILYGGQIHTHIFNEEEKWNRENMLEGKTI